MLLLTVILRIDSYAADPYEDYIKISTAEELLGINDDPAGKYVLTEDIDLTELTKEGGDFDTGNGWTPLANDEEKPFTGIFDGNGHRIIGMNIYGNLSDIGSYVGLFARVEEGTIKNVGLSNVNINVNRNSGYISGYIGSIAGLFRGDSIIGCWSDGTITVENSELLNYHEINIGGIVGYVGYGTISDSYSNIDIKYKGISSSYYTHINGIANRNLLHSYYSGNIQYDIDTEEGTEDSINVKPIGGGGVENCYYLKDCIKDVNGNVKNSSEYQGTVKTETMMKSQNGFSGFDFTDTWIVDKNSPYLYPQLLNNMQQRMEGYDPMKLGEQQITLSYGGARQENAFTVEVKVLSQHMVDAPHLPFGNLSPLRFGPRRTEVHRTSCAPQGGRQHKISYML